MRGGQVDVQFPCLVVLLGRLAQVDHVFVLAANLHLDLESWSESWLEGVRDPWFGCWQTECWSHQVANFD